MATDTAAPAPPVRRNYWQLPTFVLGAAAAAAAWTAFPPPTIRFPAQTTDSVAALRVALDRRPIDLQAVETLTPQVAATAGEDAVAHFLAGSGPDLRGQRLDRGQVDGPLVERRAQRGDVVG